MMINCVSEAVPPARCNCPGTQLMCGKKGEYIHHTIPGIKGTTIFSKIIPSFTNCFMQHVVQLSGKDLVSLLQSFGNKLAGNTCKTSRSYSRCITAARIVRCNHYYLADTRKSETSVSISEQSKNNCYTKLENYNFHVKLQGDKTNGAKAYAYYDFYDFHKETTTSLKTQGENTAFYKIISGITKVLFLQRPHDFL